jgi:hypothetical protein
VCIFLLMTKANRKAGQMHCSGRRRDKTGVRARS